MSVGRTLHNSCVDRGCRIFVETSHVYFDIIDEGKISYRI
ncbi:hypothetical protein Echvi_1634 [Echinicola vietnamensis DSM 17526]|uniref:Uncharacterized protein n=1 Tax=Echinicola vietnamensis (strain DSM 17526 / LMG 23754 / KMM 6221) TaxID=926556 RepID=L0FVH1_ECHVK|nr:hypothetical protein Echvi_1634 [Echinicola vietnamensis DSM 17526]